MKAHMFSRGLVELECGVLRRMNEVDWLMSLEK